VYAEGQSEVSVPEGIDVEAGERGLVGQGVPAKKEDAASKNSVSFPGVWADSGVMPARIRRGGSEVGDVEGRGAAAGAGEEGKKEWKVVSSA
jgi:hypothetical protein